MWIASTANLGRTPTPTHYRTIQSQFDIYGWDVAVERDAVEFLTLDDVDAKSLTVTGSGAVEIITPALYRPSTHYRVEIEGTGDAVSRTTTVRSDRRGRLRFAVDLGPSHDHDQFTPEQVAAEATSSDYWRTAQVQISRR